MHQYRVKAICTATVEETWTVRSSRPLTDDEVCEVVRGGVDALDDADVEMDCIDEDVYDETDRNIESVEAL